MRLVKNPILRHTLFGVGILFAVLAVVGIFVPLWPTTPFLLVSAWCFFRSSKRAYYWIRTRPYVGPALIDWETRGAIAVPIKLLALGTISFSLGLMWYTVTLMWVKVLVTTLMGLASLFIVTRPSQ